MAKIKIENFIKKIWSKDTINIPEDINDITLCLKKIKDDYYKKYPKQKNNEAKMDLKKMNRDKNDFINNSLKTEEVKKEFLLTDEDLKNIEASELFGLTRFLHVDIIKYLNKKFKNKKC